MFNTVRCFQTLKSLMKKLNIFSDFARSVFVNTRGIDSTLVVTTASVLTFSFRTAAMNNDELITDGREERSFQYCCNGKDFINDKSNGFR